MREVRTQQDQKVFKRCLNAAMAKHSEGKRRDHLGLGSPGLLLQTGDPSQETRRGEMENERREPSGYNLTIANESEECKQSKKDEKHSTT